MNILITGSSGFIGTNLLKKLIYNKKFNILLLNRKKKIFKSKKRILSIKSDINLNSSVLNKIEKFSPNILIHLAWENIPDYSKKNSELNVYKQINFFKKILKIKSLKKIIITGSCSEYKNKSHLTSTFFVKAKKKIKQYLKNNNISLVWLKLFFVYGKGQRKNSLIPFIVSSIKNKKNIVLKKPNMICDFIHVNDVCKFLLNHLNKKKENIEYDIGSGYGLKVKEILNFFNNINNVNNFKLKKYKKCFKANIFYKKLKTKMKIENNLKSMIY